MKTKVTLTAICVLFFSILLGTVAGSGLMIDTNIKGIVVYPNGIVQITESGIACCGNEFRTIIEGTDFPGSVRVIEGSAEVKSVSFLPYKSETKNETKVQRPLSIEDMLNQSMHRRIEIITSYGDIVGTLYALENDLMFLANVTWVRDNDTISAPFFTMRTSDIRNLIFRENPDFEPVYITVKPDVPDVETLSQPYYYSSSYYGYPSNPYGNNLLSWTDNGIGVRNVTLVYRTNGISWEPAYHLDVYEGEEKAGFDFWVKVTNNMKVDLNSVDLKLIAGNIRSGQGDYYNYRQYTTGTQMAYENIAFGRAVGAAISALEEYEVYQLGSISLKSGETKIVRIFDRQVQFEKNYVWDARSDDTNWRYTDEMKKGKVQNIYNMKNEENETWPYGTASVYNDLMFIGEDTISWTPPGGEAKVTVGYAPDIEVKKRVTVKEIRSNDYRYDTTLKMTNYKSKRITLTVMDTFPNNANEGTFSSNTEYKEKPGNLIYWNVTLNPGEERNITYTYETS